MRKLCMSHQGIPLELNLGLIEFRSFYLGQKTLRKMFSRLILRDKQRHQLCREVQMMLGKKEPIEAFE